jgi:hypothetical protein
MEISLLVDNDDRVAVVVPDHLSGMVHSLTMRVHSATNGAQAPDRNQNGCDSETPSIKLSEETAAEKAGAAVIAEKHC